jgi:hypothetical protein
MSDLAPFVAAVLYDKVLAETKQEVDRLSEQLQKSRAVQMISANGTVYAEGQFEEGCFNGDSNLWMVRLHKQLAPCPLSDLTNVQICIGGICKADFGASSAVREAVAGEANRYIDGWGYINFSFVGTGFLCVRVGPSPSEEVFLSQLGGDIDIDEENMASYLAQEVAVNHPLLSVNFGMVFFLTNAVKGAIQNLNLDPAIVEQA